MISILRPLFGISTWNYVPTLIVLNLCYFVRQILEFLDHKPWFHANKMWASPMQCHRNYILPSWRKLSNYWNWAWTYLLENNIKTIIKKLFNILTPWCSPHSTTAVNKALKKFLLKVMIFFVFNIFLTIPGYYVLSVNP